jgi:glucosamine-6-phosphate deaminase
LSARVYAETGDRSGYVCQAGFDSIQQEQMVLKYVDVHGKITRRDTKANMRIIVVAPAVFASTAAAVIIRQLQVKPDSVLGLATGQTTVGLHRELVRAYQDGMIDFSRVITFNVDEYLGIPADHPVSCRSRITAQLLRHVNIPVVQTHIPRSQPRCAEEECARYEQQIAARGGIDLQVLGIGGNGHIGFNEPGAAFAACTHITAVAPSTIQAKAGIFGDASLVPRQGITMGLRTIMQARRILLLATGADKAEILAQALGGPVLPAIPASVLQRHPSLTVILDSPAATKLGVLVERGR